MRSLERSSDLACLMRNSIRPEDGAPPSWLEAAVMGAASAAVRSLAAPVGPRARERLDVLAPPHASGGKRGKRPRERTAVEIGDHAALVPSHDGGGLRHPGKRRDD